jgi:RNA polymerase sigma factor (sigma-70 family)
LHNESMSNGVMTEDRALVSKVLEGDTRAFKLLIQQHERLVLHMIGRVVRNDVEREELCQDVFLRVHEKLAEFSFQSKLSTWIATIAYRHAINFARKQKMMVSELPDEAVFTERFIEPENPESLISERDMNDFVMRLIELLPVQYKLVITLYHVDQLNYAEIGKITGMPEGTVKNYLFRARLLLKEKVKKYIGKEEML